MQQHWSDYGSCGLWRGISLPETLAKCYGMQFSPDLARVS